MNERSHTQRKPYEWALAVALFLVAFWFRTTRLADVPPGLHHDDIKNVLLVEKIMDGYWRIYYPENYGHEPLYHWLQAAYFGVIGSGYPELRLLSVGISMFGLAAIYALARRLLGGEVALWTLAWQAVSLWPLFYSRRAIRGILLPPLAALAGYFFLRGLDGLGRLSLSLPADHGRLTDHGGEKEGRALGARTAPLLTWILGGVALAGCLYTYAGSRVLPIFFGLYVGYLALFHRETLRARWRGILLFALVAALLAAPLAAYLAANPEERMGQINEPWTAFKAGDPMPLVQNSLRVLGMFTFIGDPHWRQFVADTPVFGLPGALLFYGGLLIALWRWRRREYAFLLLWLPVALLPGMLSEGAPNFLRPIAAVTVTYCFPALAASELLAWLRRRLKNVSRGRAPQSVTLALLVAILGLHAWRTYDGYFVRWPRHPDARFAYSSTLLDVSRWLDASPEVEHVLLSGHFPSDLDPEMVERFLRREDLEPRWADVRQALIYPAMESPENEIVVIEPDYLPIDPALRELYVEDEPIYEGVQEGATVFSVYRLPVSRLEERLKEQQGWRVKWDQSTVFPEGWDERSGGTEYPPGYSQRVKLLDSQILNETVHPGDVLTVLTVWWAAGPGPASGTTFMHLLGRDGVVVAGFDGLGAPPARWQFQDRFIQVHRFAVPHDLEPGRYPIELGWYEKDSGARWTVGRRRTSDLVDRLLIVLDVVAKDE